MMPERLAHYFGLGSLLVGLCSGCGKGEVVGTATLNGKAITSGSVIILAADSITYSGGLDGNGKYRIANVPRGEAKVAVASPNPAAFGPNAKWAKKDPIRFKSVPAAVAPPNWFPVPAKFADFETS